MKQFRFFTVLIILLCTTGLHAKRICYYFYFDRYDRNIYSDDNVKISIDKPRDETSICVYVQNKTDKIIYIDKGNSFAIRNGIPVNMYSNKATTNGVTYNNGVSVNVGSVVQGLGVNSPVLNGITVGGSNGVINQTTTYEKRVIPVAPHSYAVLWKYVDPFHLMSITGFIENNGEKSFPLKPRSRYIEPATREKVKLTKGFVRTYDESNSPIHIKAVVTYSLTEDFKEKTQATAYNYLKAFVADSYKGWKNYNKKNAPYCVPFMNGDYYCWLRYKEGQRLEDWESIPVYVVLIPAATIGLLSVVF